jgi:ligand-binding sensor domain-containing protein
MLRRPPLERRPALAGPAFALALALARVASAADIAASGVPMFRAFGTDDGLPQSSVNAVAFAPDGRLWIGTQSGPAVYDGQRFTAVSLPIAGSGAWVQAIGATEDGAVWFGLESGDVFRHAGAQFTRFGPAEGLDARMSIVNTIVETRAGEGRALWVGTADGLYRLADDGKRFHPIELGPDFDRAGVGVVR